MIVAVFPAGPLQANCYLAGAEAGAGCVVVDPGMSSVEGIASVVAEHDLRPEAVLLTHGHFDHMWCAAEVADTYGAPVWIHPADRHLLSDPMAAISGESGEMLRSQLPMEQVPTFAEPEAGVRDAVDGATIEAGGLRLTVRHVPGHTAGTVMYAVPYDGPEEVSELLFTGDFLFAGSIGRCDLAGGDPEEMDRSLRSAVLPLADDVVVLPGHGPQTSIGRERAGNPFLAELV